MNIKTITRPSLMVSIVYTGMMCINSGELISIYAKHYFRAHARMSENFLARISKCVFKKTFG